MLGGRAEIVRQAAGVEGCWGCSAVIARCDGEVCWQIVSAGPNPVMASWRAVPWEMKEDSCSVGDESETYPCALPPGPGGHLESIVPWSSEVRPLMQFCAKWCSSTSCDDGLSSLCELQTRSLRVARGPATCLTVYRRFVGFWIRKARRRLRSSIASFFCFFSPSLMFVE